MNFLELVQQLRPISENPRLEAKWILEEVTSDKKIRNILKRRSLGEPLSKILGHKGFWKGDFITSKDVLDPRPDSETIIEAVLKQFPQKKSPYSILDIGTGSGCLLISLLMEYKNAHGLGIDVSKNALKIACKNAKRNNTKALFKVLDMNKIKDHFDFAISNPPYIPHKQITKLEKAVVKYDPHLALDGGMDGLKYYKILAKIKSIPVLFIEIGKGQKTSIVKIFKNNHWKFLEGYKDYAGVTRVLVFQKILVKEKKLA